MTGLITRVLEDRGKPAPVLVGGMALSYYTRDVYFTADIDLAYVDRDALDAALRRHRPRGPSKGGRLYR